LKKIRYETLRSHVDARKKYDGTEYVKPEPLVRYYGSVGKKRNNTSNG